MESSSFFPDWNPIIIYEYFFGNCAMPPFLCNSIPFLCEHFIKVIKILALAYDKIWFHCLILCKNVENFIGICFQQVIFWLFQSHFDCRRVRNVIVNIFAKCTNSMHKMWFSKYNNCCFIVNHWLRSHWGGNMFPDLLSMIFPIETKESKNNQIVKKNSEQNNFHFAIQIFTFVLLNQRPTREY